MSRTKINAGFSLIELMIVVVIIGIIASIAYPNYQEYLAQSRRADAQAALASLANAMERNFTTTGRYDRDVNNDPVTVLGVFGRTTVGDNVAYYELSFEEPDDDGAPDGTTLDRNVYILHAYPTGVQVNDRCGVLSLSSTGVRSAELGGVVVPNCWR